MTTVATTPPPSTLPQASPTAAPLVDRYLRVVSEVKRLEMEREELKLLILEAVGGAPGNYAGPRGGGVRVNVLRTARFEPARVVAALDRARLLASLAHVDARRLREALDGAGAVEAAVGALVRRVDAPYVAALPASYAARPTD